MRILPFCSFSLFMFLFSTSIVLKAQYNTGLLMDNKRYQQTPLLATGKKAIGIATVCDLSPYMPVAGNQGDMNSCVTWAVGYETLTASFNIRDNIVKKSDIKNAARSALYIYNQISGGNCQLNIIMDSALEIIKRQGDCLFSEFNPNNCKQLPGKDLQEKAAQNKIKSYLRLFDTTAVDQDKIDAIMNSVGNKRPVIIGIKVYESLTNVNASESLWQPDINKEKMIGYHALVVVGYNIYNKRFKVMNSWGTKWGDKGFFFVSYNDLAKVTQTAYEITVDTRKDNILTLSGELKIQKFSGWDDNKQKPVFNDLLPAYSPATFEYYLPAGTVKKDDLFRIIASNGKKECYVYVFSINPSGKAEVLFPFSENKRFSEQHNIQSGSVEIPHFNPGESVEIPGDGQAIKTDETGNDYLCVLYSANIIEDINKMVDDISAVKKESFLDKLKAVLGDKLIDPSKVNFNNGKISITVTADKGDIVPVILKTDVQ